MLSAKVKSCIPYLIYLLFLLLVFLKIDFRKIIFHITSVKSNYLGLVVLLNILVLFFRGIVFRLLLKKLGYEISLFYSTLMVSVGQSFGLLTPGRSGDIGRYLLLKEKYGIPTKDGITTILFERIFYLLVFLCLLIASVVYAYVDITPVWGVICISVLIIGLPFMLNFFFNNIGGIFTHKLPLFVNRWFKNLTQRKESIRTHSMKAIIRKLSGSTYFTFYLVILTLLATITSVLQVYYIFLSLDIQMNFLEVWFCYCIPYLIAIISLIPFGLGSLDFSLIMLVSKFGYSTAIGASATFISRGTITVPFLIIGFLGYFYHNVLCRKLWVYESKIKR